MTEKISNADQQSLISTMTASELAEFCGQGHMLNQLHCLAEFNLNAEFIRVNANYLELTGYGAEDLLGKNLCMLLDLKYQHSLEYQLLWQRLRHGETVSGQFKRMAKGAKSVWINATYVPVVELTGKVLKVVEYATDVTEHVLLKHELTETVLQVNAVLMSVQNGDLRQKIPLLCKNAELADLCTQINALIDSASAIVALVKRNASSIAQAAGRLETACRSLINSQRH
jgi:methyl-accepting chemotaxis protein